MKAFTEKQYSMPFNEENLKSLYDMRPGKESSSVSLILLRIGYDDIPKDHPYLIENYEDFANRPFDSYGIMCLPPNTNLIGVLEIV